MITPDAPISIAAHKLRRMIAASAIWQQAIAATVYPDADQMAGIYLRDVAAGTPRPHGNVMLGQGSAWNLASGGYSNGLLPSGSLAIYLAVDTPDELRGSKVDAEFYAGNLFDGTIADVANLSNADDPTAGDGLSYLNITNIQQIHFGRVDEADWETTGDFFDAVYLCKWGDGGQ